MKKTLRVLLFLVFASGFAAWSQPYPYCITGRFAENDLFSDLALISHQDLVYGMNLNAMAGTDTLRMNLYEVNPAIDNLPKRPLVLLFHGGDFTGGQRADLDAYAKQLARRGYVAASVGYRTGWSSNGAAGQCNGSFASYRYAAYRAVQDAHAAIRFLAAHALTYGIDTSSIFLAGRDAGALTVLQAGFLQQAEASQLYPGAEADIGGLFSAGNNEQATYRIRGIFSWSGAFPDTSMLNAGEVPSVLCLHGSQDTVFAPVQGSWYQCPSYPVLYGPSAIRHRMLGQGLCTEVNYDANGGHGDFPSLESQFYVPQKMTCFFKGLLCGVCTPQEKVSYSISSCMDTAPLGLPGEAGESALTLYPNPLQGQPLRIAGPFADGQYYAVSCLDLSGRVIRPRISVRAQGQQLIPDLGAETLQAGIYMLEVEGFQRRLLFSVP